MQSETKAAPPNTYPYRGINIEILIGGYRFKKLITKTKEEMEEIIDAVIEAYKLYSNSKNKY